MKSEAKGGELEEDMSVYTITLLSAKGGGEGKEDEVELEEEEEEEEKEDGAGGGGKAGEGSEKKSRITVGAGALKLKVAAHNGTGSPNSPSNGSGNATAAAAEPKSVGAASQKVQRVQRVGETTTSATDAALSDDWIIKRSKKRKMDYYYNVKTKVLLLFLSSLSSPLLSSPPISSSPTFLSLKAQYWKDSSLPPGWGFDKSGKEKVYVRLATGERTAVKPSGDAAGDAAVPLHSGASEASTDKPKTNPFDSGFQTNPRDKPTTTNPFDSGFQPGGGGGGVGGGSGGGGEGGGNRSDSGASFTATCGRVFTADFDMPAR
jgi:hypothetical protein